MKLKPVENLEKNKLPTKREILIRMDTHNLSLSVPWKITEQFVAKSK